jgi:DNA repair protein RecN (Recombination protein N)
MLRFLGVRHLAVVEHLEIEFDAGLNLLTGETGAGKTVLVEAIDLLLGGRASADLVRTGESTATVQAIFERPDGREVVVRREISAQGKSRAFIDDTLATSGALRELGRQLVDLHGQHEHHALLDPNQHLALLDTSAGEAVPVADLAARFAAWRTAAGDLERSQLDTRERQSRLELATFHLQEIDKVAPRAGEDEALAAERTVLANVDRLSRLADDAYGALYDGEHAALSSLAVTWKRVADLAALDPHFQPYLDQREEVKAALDELAHALRSYRSQLEASPDRLQAVEDRSAAIERLKRKYGPTLEDVLARHVLLTHEIESLDASADRIATRIAAEAETRQAFVVTAAHASNIRRAAAVSLARGLERALADLAMPHARVDVRLATLDRPEDWTSAGMDQVEFFFSPNPGEDLKPLARIASGGELSRVMLALHTLVAVGERGRTLVFDEVDAGIGGAAADAVGARLHVLAQHYQVVCVTHLPQIAARLGAHYRIWKDVRGGRTSTAVSRLDESGRQQELARMIAGLEVTPQVLASAQELLAARGESDMKAKGESAGRAKAKGRSRGV